MYLLTCRFENWIILDCFIFENWIVPTVHCVIGHMRLDSLHWLEKAVDSAA